MAKQLTAKEIAEKAGISPANLRKLLRKEFNRVGKTKVEGNRLEYRFDPNDPTTKLLTFSLFSLVSFYQAFNYSRGKRMQLQNIWRLLEKNIENGTNVF